MDGNPLVAPEQNQTTAVTGIGIAESAQGLAHGVSNGDWVEAGLSAAGVGLEVLSMAIDPLGTLASYGASWLIEHVRPLKEALDWFAGDPPVIQSFSETWGNVAAEVNAVATELLNEANSGTTGWTGMAADSYRGHTAEAADAIQGAAALAEGISVGVMIMGEVVAFVREFIRDLVGELVGRLIAWALEVAATLGLATPAVVAQATAAISRTIAKVTDVVRKLVRTIGNVTPRIKKVISKLDEIIAKLAKLMRKADGGTTPTVSHTTPSNAPDVPTPNAGTTPSSTTSPSSTATPGTSPDGTTSPNPTTTSPDVTGPDGAPGSPSTKPSGNSRPDNPNDTATPETQRSCANDPIDVATGEVVLGQTDLVLPGVLPLALRRTHISSYRAGRLYGGNWASTLDQRLEFDEQGVVFVADDGMLLVYPEPPDTGDVLPVVGPEWPLRRSENGFTVSDPRAGSTLRFAARGRVAPLTEIVDRNDNRITLLRDVDGALVEIRHSGGYHIDVATEAGRITELRLRAGASLVRYRYNDRHELSEVVNSSNLPLTFEYDSDGRITSWVDRNGMWYRYFYDLDGRCVANQGSGGYLNGSFSYDRDARTTRFTDALGNSTTYRFDQRNNIVEETDPLGHVTRSEWDNRDRLLSRTDPLGRTTRCEYDGTGHLVGMTRADGARTLVEYGEAGLPTVIVEPGGLVSRREYDARGNVVALTDVAGARSRFGYDARGALTWVRNAAGGVRRFETNAAGLVVSATDDREATTRYQRDMLGRVTAVVDPVGGTTTYGWTVEGRLLHRTFPDGATERWSYDGEGNLVEYRDPAGRLSRTESGGFDLTTARIGPDGARHEFGYDTNLRLVSVTNPRGLIWRYGYDAVGNLVSETDFDGRTQTYRHDAAGRLVSRTGADGETTTYVRDLLGNAVERRVGDTVQATFDFDEAGYMVRAATPEVVITYDRDPRGRVLNETVDGRTLTSTYDVLGRRVHRRTPGGAESTWTYDTNDNPTELVSGGHSVRFGYDVAGRELTRQVDSTVVLTQVWDANHRLSTQRLTASSSPEPGASSQPRLLQERRYHYAPNGFIVGLDDRLNGSRQFDLDPAGRVTAVRGKGWSERYTYDAAGNLVQARWPTAPDDADSADSVGGRDYVGTVIRRAGRTHYEHDVQGRVTRRVRNTLSGQRRAWTYRWDGDRLAGVRTPDGAVWGYSYDAFGRRTAKKRLSADLTTVLEETVFTWDGVTLAEQETVSKPGVVAITTWDFQPGTFRPVSQTERISPRDAPQELVDQQFYALITDTVGTPTEMVDATGNVAWRATVSLWGKVLTAARGDADCPLRFPGQYHDRETGNNYNYRRYYDPSNGRYESGDPLGLSGSPNPYTYVTNPMAWSDPLGLTPCDTDEIPTTRGNGPTFAVDSNGNATPLNQNGGAATFAVDSNGNATSLTAGNRPDGELVFSGHGGIPPGDGSTVVVPPGTTVHMYSPHGTTISDSLGNDIELHGTATPHQTFGPGQTVPDYHLGPPYGLNIMGNPVTVTTRTRLSELLQANQGNVHWAACREIGWVRP